MERAIRFGTLPGHPGAEARHIGNVAGNGAGNGAAPMNPVWADFIRFCAELGHGEIGRLKIQDGVPVLAEVTTRKVKFGR